MKTRCFTALAESFPASVQFLLSRGAREVSLMSYLTRRFDQPSYGSQKNYAGRIQVMISCKLKQLEFCLDYEKNGIVWLLLGRLIHASIPANGHTFGYICTCLSTVEM